MKIFFNLRPTCALLAVALAATSVAPAMAQQTNNLGTSGSEQPAATVQSASYNGYSCDMVKAKVAESGVTAAYAYARYMGLSHRDILRVRKACAV